MRELRARSWRTLWCDPAKPVACLLPTRARVAFTCRHAAGGCNGGASRVNWACTPHFLHSLGCVQHRVWCGRLESPCRLEWLQAACAGTASACRAVFLHVAAYNAAACAFYRRRGFQEVARLPAFYFIACAHIAELESMHG